MDWEIFNEKKDRITADLNERYKEKLAIDSIYYGERIDSIASGMAYEEIISEKDKLIANLREELAQLDIGLQIDLQISKGE